MYLEKFVKVNGIKTCKGSPVHKVKDNKYLERIVSQIK